MPLRNFERTESRSITESRWWFVPPAIDSYAHTFPLVLFSNPVSRSKRARERESLEARGRGGWKREKEEEAAGSHGGNWEVQTFTVMRRRFEWGFLAWQQLVAEKKPPLDEFLRNLRVRFYRFTITRWQRLSETLFPSPSPLHRPLLTERKSSKLFEHASIQVPPLLPFEWDVEWRIEKIEIKLSSFLLF